MWEDGVPLTSGRSGLASAVIFQPSCPQNYSQDCLLSLERKHDRGREYDDDRKPNDDSGGSGEGPSMHYNYSSQVYSRGSTSGSGGGLRDESDDISGDQQQSNCDAVSEDSLKKEFSFALSQIRSRYKCKERESKESYRKINDEVNTGEEPLAPHHSKLGNLMRNHTKCKLTQTPCPIERLKRKLQLFIANRRMHCKQQRKLNETKGET